MKVVVWADLVEDTRFANGVWKERLQRFFWNHAWADEYRLVLDEFTGPVAHELALQGRTITPVPKIELAAHEPGVLHCRGYAGLVPNIGLGLAIEAAKRGKCDFISGARRLTVCRASGASQGALCAGPESMSWGDEFGLQKLPGGQLRILPAEFHRVPVAGDWKHGIPDTLPLLSCWHPVTQAELDFMTRRQADVHLEVWLHLLDMLEGPRSDPEHPDDDDGGEEPGYVNQTPQ